MQMKYSIPKVPNMNDTINLIMYMNIVGKYLLISID